MIAQVCAKDGVYLDCAYLRKGWGTPRWQIGDLEGGGYPSVANLGSRGWGVPLGASIHDVEIWVSGWGELEGGKVTRSQLPRGVSDR